MALAAASIRREVLDMDDLSQLAIEGNLLGLLAEINRSCPSFNGGIPAWLKKAREILQDRYRRAPFRSKRSAIPLEYTRFTWRVCFGNIFDARWRNMSAAFGSAPLVTPFGAAMRRLARLRWRPGLPIRRILRAFSSASWASLPVSLDFRVIQS